MDIVLKHFPEEQPILNEEVYIFPDQNDINNYIVATYRPDLMPLVFFIDENQSPLPYNDCYWFPGPTLDSL